MAAGRDNQKSFFGRRKGKTLRPKQRQAVDDVLPLYRIDISDPTPVDAAGLFEADVDRVRLEIGFGGGEHFLHRAAEQPETGFIGVEPFVNGMAKCAAALAEEPLRNVRLFDEEAALLLDWLPEGSVDHIDLLYPDPWPKKRHWKRRFVNEESLDRLARVLKPGGVFCFASDIDTYVNWTLLHCRHHPAFAWQAETAQDWRRPYPGWPGTRYEAKAVREGRTPAYLTFRRV